MHQQLLLGFVLAYLFRIKKILSCGALLFLMLSRIQLITASSSADFGIRQGVMAANSQGQLAENDQVSAHAVRPK